MVCFSLVLIVTEFSGLDGRALNCRAEGRGFDSRGRTNTLGLKFLDYEESSFFPQGYSRASETRERADKWGLLVVY